MTSRERWLVATWPFVRAQLPAAPARVLEVGCGPLGGYVPLLAEAGYDAVGVDPEAPEGAAYERSLVEAYRPAAPVDAVVASRSFHHVDDVPAVVDGVGAKMREGAPLVVLEWEWESFDEATARWCFARLAAPASGEDHDWLERRRAGWEAAGGGWDVYFSTWAAGHGLHPGSEIREALAARFTTRQADVGPYFFAELDGTTERDEQEAIDAGRIRATGIRWVGTAP